MPGRVPHQAGGMKILLALTGVALATLALFPGVAAAADDIPAFTFDDCPAIPAGADPAAWRCEEMHATGTVKLGKVELPVTLKTTHAEGRPPGAPATEFIFGTLRSDPVALAGRPRADFTLQYAGFIDFAAGPPMAEILHLKYHVDSPLTRAGCSIGTDDDPLVVVGEIVGDRVPVQQDPPVLKFAVRDDGFAVPAAHGCGPAGRLIDRRLGLPSTGSLQLTVYFSVRTYDEVQPSNDARPDEARPGDEARPSDDARA